MDTKVVSNSIKKFMREHKARFYAVSSNQSKALELSGIVGVAEHYKSNDYAIEIVNPAGHGDTFTVKTSTRGFPWSFSRIMATKGTTSCELHMNLMVRSAHDDGVYCVDVGVAQEGSVPATRPKQQWQSLPNEKLISFAEVKKLVVYPMLLAQFVGIVHEIRPEFIGGKLRRGFLANKHLHPALISLGNFSGNSQTIVDAYGNRGIKLQIAENYDVRLAKCRGGAWSTPFSAWDDDV